MGTLATICPPQIDSAAPLARCCCVSPTQRIAISPARLAARAFLATRAGLAVMQAPLRMSDDDGARSGVFEHLRADVAGMSAGRFGVTVLPADGDSATRCPRRGGKQGGRRTNQNGDMRRSPRRQSGDRLDLVQLGPQSMHLPISGNQRAHVCLRVRFLPRRRFGTGFQCSRGLSIVGEAFSDPLGRAVDRSAFSMMSRKGFMMSIGMGKTTVEFCSAPISVNVWR